MNQPSKDNQITPNDEQAGSAHGADPLTPGHILENEIFKSTGLSKTEDIERRNLTTDERHTNPDKGVDLLRNSVSTFITDQSTDLAPIQPQSAKYEIVEDKRLNHIVARNMELEKSLKARQEVKKDLLKHYSQSTTKPLKPPSASSENDDEDIDALLIQDAKLRVKEHITLLHQYNEIRDIGLGLMGIVAEQRAVRLRDVQEEFGVTAKD